MNYGLFAFHAVFNKHFTTLFFLCQTFNAPSQKTDIFSRNRQSKKWLGDGPSDRRAGFRQIAQSPRRS